jgi:hypothetical protein
MTLADGYRQWLQNPSIRSQPFGIVMIGRAGMSRPGGRIVPQKTSDTSRPSLKPATG